MGKNGVQSPDYTELGGEDNIQIDNDNDETNNLGDNIINSNNDKDEQQLLEKATIHKKSLIKEERDFFEFPQAGEQGFREVTLSEANDEQEQNQQEECSDPFQEVDEIENSMACSGVPDSSIPSTNGGSKLKFQINKLARKKKKKSIRLTKKGKANKNSRVVANSSSNVSRISKRLTALNDDSDQEQNFLDSKQPIHRDCEVNQSIKESVEMSSENQIVIEQCQQQPTTKDSLLDQQMQASDDSLQSSPTEDTTENILHYSGMKYQARKQTRSGTATTSNLNNENQIGGNFIDFTSRAGLQKKAQSLRQSNQQPQQSASGHDITPMAMKPSFCLTAKNRQQIISIEESMQSNLEDGQIMDQNLLRLACQHMSICHPEAMVSNRPQDAEEPKKRGRKSQKQKVQELAKKLKMPLTHIQCKISFSIPDEYAQALSAGNASSSSRVSSTSKTFNDGNREFESIILECKTRNMRRKVQELSVAAPQPKKIHKQIAQAQQTQARASLAEVEVEQAAQQPQPSRNQSQCLLNMSFDLSVDKLLQIAASEKTTSEQILKNTDSAILKKLTAKRNTAANDQKVNSDSLMTAVAGLVASNVKITSDR